FTDLEERILPDEFTLGGAVAGLVFAAFVKTPGVMVDVIASGASARTQSYLASVLGAVALCCPVWLIAVAYEHLRKREGLGLGDVKLLLMMGIFLGFEEGLKAFLWSAVTGAVIGLAYALIRRRKIAELEMPFGSFLCAGAGLVPLLHRITS